jgi:hypothetical protein
MLWRQVSAIMGEQQPSEGKQYRCPEVGGSSLYLGNHKDVIVLDTKDIKEKLEIKSEMWQ